MGANGRGREEDASRLAKCPILHPYSGIERFRPNLAGARPLPCSRREEVESPFRERKVVPNLFSRKDHLSMGGTHAVRLRCRRGRRMVRATLPTKVADGGDMRTIVVDGRPGWLGLVPIRPVHPVVLPDAEPESAHPVDDPARECSRTGITVMETEQGTTLGGRRPVRGTVKDRPMTEIFGAVCPGLSLCRRIIVRERRTRRGSSSTSLCVPASERNERLKSL